MSTKPQAFEGPEYPIVDVDDAEPMDNELAELAGHGEGTVQVQKEKAHGQSASDVLAEDGAEMARQALADFTETEAEPPDEDEGDDVTLNVRELP